MNKYEHCLFVIILCVWLFVHIILNVFLMINRICHAFKHNSMVTYCRKTVHDAKIGGARH